MESATYRFAVLQKQINTGNSRTDCTFCIKMQGGFSIIKTFRFLILACRNGFQGGAATRWKASGGAIQHVFTMTNAHRRCHSGWISSQNSLLCNVIQAELRHYPAWIATQNRLNRSAVFPSFFNTLIFSSIRKPLRFHYFDWECPPFRILKSQPSSPYVYAAGSCINITFVWKFPQPDIHLYIFLFNFRK